MSARFGRRCVGVLCSGLFPLVMFVAAAPDLARAQETDEATTRSAKIAEPAKAVAGKLVRVRPEKFRKDENDLLNKIDLARDVVYTTTESPVPESEQFQFVDGVLRTPERGDARLCLPDEVPEFYRLSLDTVRKDVRADPPIGVGAVMSGYQFFVELRLKTFSISRFYEQKIAGPLIRQDTLSGNPGPAGVAEVLVGDCGMLLRHRGQCIEWIAAGPSLSMDPKWEVPAKDKIFLTFPEGQFDLRSVKFESFSREKWIEEVKLRMPGGQIVATVVRAEKAKIPADVDPLPPRAVLREAIELQARDGDFDELERWAERFRGEELSAAHVPKLERFYSWLVRSYVSPMPGSHGELDFCYQAQLAFCDGWLKQKPESVAARVVKALTYLHYALDVGAYSFADNLPGPERQPYLDRLRMAEQILNGAAALEPPDVCVFSSLLQIGNGLDWDRDRMQEVLERGLQISPKDLWLLDVMTQYLLPRCKAGHDDLGKFALQIQERIGGEDGLDAYARVALETQAGQVHYRRGLDMPFGLAVTELDCTDPNTVLGQFPAERLRAIIPVLRERHGSDSRTKNFLCWLDCVLDDRESAKTSFQALADEPHLDIWLSRDKFDHWRHWADPSIPEPSKFLPIEGKEIAHFQAYCDGPVELDFAANHRNLVTGSATPASTIKNWDLEKMELNFAFGLTEGYGTLGSFQRLVDAKLIVRMQNDENSVMIEYSRHNGRMRHLTANFHGMPFNFIADNDHAAAMLTDSQITIQNDLLRRRETVPMPKLSLATFSPNADYLLGIADKIHVWDGMARKELLTLDVEPKFANFTADSSAVIYATDDKLVVWEIAGNQERFSVPLDPRHRVQAATSTHDGRLLAAAERQVDVDGGGERHVVALYDLKQAEPIYVFDGHKDSIVRLAIARDDGRLASSSIDGVVKVWDLAAASAAPGK